MMGISIGIIFIAGIASFFSPCVLSLVPVYIGYLASNSGDYNHKNRTFWNGVFFVLGFSLIFIVIGLSVTLISSFIVVNRNLIAKVGGIIVILFGFISIGLINPNITNYINPNLVKKFKNSGLFTAFILGMLLSFGWTPCIGPVLGSILTGITVSNITLTKGAILLSVYCIGLGLPFLFAALGIGWINRIIEKNKKILQGVKIATGIIIILSGILLFFGVFERMNQFFPILNNWII
jgi:cytochrome c-type biogenesis protein